MSDVLASRLAAQLLSGEKARTPGEVVERLLAVQAQDFRAAKLAVRARTTGIRASDVDWALNDRELLVTWVNRAHRCECAEGARARGCRRRALPRGLIDLSSRGKRRQKCLRERGLPREE
jgi:hypothetical protein